MFNAGKCVGVPGNLRRLLLPYLKFLKILKKTSEFSVLLTNHCHSKDKELKVKKERITYSSLVYK